MLYSRLARLGELRNERGASASEYALLILLIALVIIVAAEAIGLELSSIFRQAANGI